MRIAPCVPLRGGVGTRGRAEKPAAHQHEPAEQAGDLGVDPEKQREIGERPDGEEGDVSGILPDRAAEELDRRAGGEVGAVRPVYPAVAAERLRLGREGLALLDEQGQRRSRVDRHVAARRAAEGARDRGAPLGLAAHRGDAGQLGAALGEEVREAEGIVDVAADVGVQEDALGRHGWIVSRGAPR